MASGDQKIFYFLTGNNGASYILNVKDLNALTESLKFYRALSLRSKILKEGLRITLMIKARSFSNSFKTVAEVQEYLLNLAGENVNFEIDENCSVLISPTRSKIIVNHHGDYFQKYAFGDSYTRVRNEASIYELFPLEPDNFQVSEFYDLKNSAEGICSFKLSNNNVDVTGSSSTFDPVTTLVEFFNLPGTTKITIEEYTKGLLERLNSSAIQHFSFQKEVLELIRSKYGTKEFPLGLVHRDFKPWNVIEYPKILIFDFEEAITSGPPLEDLLNYYIDPIIRYQSTQRVAAYLRSENQVHYQKDYLNSLNIDLDPRIFLHFYIIERVLFWYDAKENQTATAYLKLSNHLIKSKKV